MTSAVQTLSSAPGCWQKTVSGITTTWDSIWSKGHLLIHIVAWIFFRVVCQFKPSVVLIEVLLCHTVAVIQSMRHRSKEKELFKEIANLEKKNKKLHTESHRMKQAMQVIRIGINQIQHNESVASDERDTARRERDLSVHGRSALERERDHLKNRNIQLQQQLEATQSEHLKIADHNHQLEQETQKLEQSIVTLEQKLSESTSHAQLETQFKQIQSAYKQQQENPKLRQDNLITRELEKLIPLFKDNEAKYIAMIQTCIDDNPDDEPLAIALEGIISMSQTKSEHLERISQALQCHTDLRHSNQLLIEA